MARTPQAACFSAHNRRMSVLTSSTNPSSVASASGRLFFLSRTPGHMKAQQSEEVLTLGLVCRIDVHFKQVVHNLDQFRLEGVDALDHGVPFLVMGKDLRGTAWQTVLRKPRRQGVATYAVKLKNGAP
jgi:hypothetical protein